LDEPMSALDDTTRLELHSVLRTVRQRTQVTTLHVTHSRSEAAALANRIVTLENGQIA
jgi:ABC-type sulfate/molybdate transport systems ATPase subunit